MIPVMDRDGRGILLDFRQVVFVERRDRHLILNTRTDEYRFISSIDVMTEALEPIGFSSLTTGSNVVRMDAIKKYDATKKIVYFDQILTRASKPVYVSRENLPMLNQYVRENEISIIYHR